MNDINKLTGDNLGGVLRFNFIPVNDIESIELPVNQKITTPVVLKRDARWFCGYGTIESISLTETDEETPAGTRYLPNFLAFCPKDDEDKTALFQLMRNRRFIIDCTDRNHLRKLVGTLKEPLKFSAQLATQSQMAQRAGYTIRFYGESYTRACVYDI